MRKASNKDKNPDTGAWLPSPVDRAWASALEHIRSTDRSSRKHQGQFHTPPPLANLAANLLEPPASTTLLDPATGTGILAAAVCCKAAEQHQGTRIHLTAYEPDPTLADCATRTFEDCRKWMQQQGGDLQYQVLNRDFLEEIPEPSYDSLICNPPYTVHKGKPYPNDYANFMATAARWLTPNGRMAFIVPRSFCSGKEYRKFRQHLLECLSPQRIHLFESRSKIFTGQNVTQETIVFTAARHPEQERPGQGPRDGGQTGIQVSHSKDLGDLGMAHGDVYSDEFIIQGDDKSIRLPASQEEAEALKVASGWTHNLHSLGLEASTGPVVPFRHLANGETDDHGETIPLIWAHNIGPHRIEWPRERRNKPQWACCPQTLSRPASTYVLVPRFSPKETAQRIIAAVLTAPQIPTPQVAIENHVNYIHGVHTLLDRELAEGLTTVLNSPGVNTFFRARSGNTQVNASDLRVIPLPSERELREIARDTLKGPR